MLEWIRMVANNIFSNPTFYVIGACGLLGILVDIDHPIRFYLAKDWPVRPFHIPLLVISSFVFLGICTHLGRLYVERVLK